MYIDQQQNIFAQTSIHTWGKQISNFRKYCFTDAPLFSLCKIGRTRPTYTIQQRPPYKTVHCDCDCFFLSLDSLININPALLTGLQNNMDAHMSNNHLSSRVFRTFNYIVFVTGYWLVNKHIKAPKILRYTLCFKLIFDVSFRFCFLENHHKMTSSIS